MPDDPANPAPPTLDYAKRPALALVSRHRGKLILVALLIAVAAPLAWYWVPLTHRCLWITRSRQAAAHVMPPSTPVSILGPEALRARAANPDYLPYSPGAATQPSASYYPVALRHLAHVDARVKSTLPNEVIFMGTMHRPDGSPRLVIIAGAREIDSQALLRSVNAVVLPPPGWFDPLPPDTAWPFWSGASAAGGAMPAEYWTGAIDPNDPSHVVIPHTVTDPTSQIVSRGEIDVHLQNDDSLNFALRGPGALAVARIAADPGALEQKFKVHVAAYKAGFRGAMTPQAAAAAAATTQRGRAGGN